MSGRSIFWRQLQALLWRNWLLKKRSKGQTVSEVITPIYLLAILVVIKLTTTSPLEPPVPEFQSNPLGVFDDQTSRRLLVCDNSSDVRNIMEPVKLLGNYSLEYFATVADMESAYQSLVNQSQASTVLAGVMFSEVDAASLTFNYSIRVPSEDIPGWGTFDWQANTKNCRNGTGLNRCTANKYLWSGFVPLQAAIDATIVKLYGNQSSFNLPDISVKLFPKFEYATDSLQIRLMSALYIVMAFFGFIGSLLGIIVTEKEKKIKETMRIMGLMDSAFWSSWFVVYFIESLIICTLMTLVAFAASYFAASNHFFFFLLTFLYCLSLITMAFMFTAFFSNPKSAAGVGVLANLISAAASAVIIATKTTNPATGLLESPAPPAVLWILCLLSPLSLALGMDWALFLDISVKGGCNLGPNMYVGQFPMYAPLVMLAVDIVLYSVLALWFDSVIPNEYGQARPLWYCCLPSYWKKKERTAEEIEELLARSQGLEGVDNLALEVEDEIEPVPPSMASKNAMRISNIKKKFRVKEDGKTIDKYAVDGISLDVYEGQITALLGHNGAGKTTLINMLTGLIQPTSGKATIFGLDASDTSDMIHIRSFTGVCPQENVLFPTLTPYEHLYIYGMLAGVAKEEIEKRVRQSLDEVDLGDKGDTLSLDLSGGQKRKLQLAMALIGNPKVLFLDEPTAGMDPYSRRHVWSVLKNRRPGRIIVLTTHFMDEADILADRKAVISKGKLKCAGSSLFLKNKFGVGYHLNMVIKPDVCDVQEVSKLIHDHAPSAGEGRLHGMELDFTLPHDEVNQFAALFGALERRSSLNQMTYEAMGVSSYGISMTSLEEVFLKLEEDEDDQSEKNENTNPDSALTNSVNGDTTVKFHDSPFEAPSSAPTVVEESSLFWLRFFALMKIRVKIQVRGGGFVFRIIAPIVLCVIGIVLYKYVMIVNIPPPAPPSHISLDAQTYAQSSSAMTKPPMIFDSTVDFGTPPYYKPDYPSFRFGLYSQQFVNAMDFNSSTDLFTVAPHFMGYNIHEYSVNTSTVPNQLLNTNITIIYNDSATHVVPAAINVMFNSILRSSVALPGGPNGSSLDNTRIQTTNYPWPAVTRNQPFYYGAFVMVMIVGLAMNFTVIGGASELVKDRETKVRGQLKTAGITHNMYMFTTIFADAVQVYFIAIVVIILVLAFQPAGLDNGGSLFCFIIVNLFFSPFLNIFFVYIFAYMFDKVETTQSVLPNAITWIAMMPFMATGLLGIGGTEQTRNIAFILHVVFCCIDPVYIPYGAIHTILMVQTNYIFKYGFVPVPFSAYFEWEAGIIIILVASVFHITWMFFVWKYLEFRVTSGGTVSCFSFFTGLCKNLANQISTENGDVPDGEDEDVTEERERVLAMEETASDKTPVVKVLQLRKSFKKGVSRKTKEKKVNVAVKNVSFAVMPGEVFGLLGPNGAGKTTTLNMVIAETNPEKGSVSAGGYDVHSSMSEAFGVMGYCPQHDALWERITPREHVECYSLLKGVQAGDASRIADFYMSELSIEEHVDKQARDLSGGTKRKLSYAMSMLGDPKIVLLDEPSTGMDPKSKRFLWDTITHSFEKSSRGAILTTHYMEEADALCNRIAIMVNGRMECIGSAQHLKNKYGSGYILEIKVEGSDDKPDELREHLEACHAYITRLFPNAVRAEFFSDWMTYKIMQDDVQSLSLTFQALEDGKNNSHIEQYSFSQCTLEQVFLQFAKVQDEKDEDESNELIKRQTSLLSRQGSANGRLSTDL